MPVQTRSQTRALSSAKILPSATNTKPRSRTLKLLNNIFIKHMYSQFHKLNNCKSLVEEIEEFVALSEFFQDSYLQAHWCPAVREIFERMKAKSFEFLSRIKNHEFDETFENQMCPLISFEDFKEMPSVNLNCCFDPASWETYNK